MYLAFESGERGIAEVGRGVEFEPARGEAIGEKLLQGLASSSEVAVAGSPKSGNGLALGDEIDLNGLALCPIRRDLKNGGAAEPAMSEEHLFAERGSASRRDDLGGDASEFGVAMIVGILEDKGNQSGTHGNEFMS